MNRFNERGSGRDGPGDPGSWPISHSRPLRFQNPAPEMFVGNAVFQKMGNPTSRFNESGLDRDGSGHPRFRLISHSRPLRFQIPAPEMFVENAVFQKMGNPTSRFIGSGLGRDGSEIQDVRDLIKSGRRNGIPGGGALPCLSHCME